MHFSAKNAFYSTMKFLKTSIISSFVIDDLLNIDFWVIIAKLFVISYTHVESSRRFKNEIVRYFIPSISLFLKHIDIAK